MSPASEVRLEWKVGRFSLLPAAGVTCGGSTRGASLRGHRGHQPYPAGVTSQVSKRTGAFVKHPS